MSEFWAKLKLLEVAIFCKLFENPKSISLKKAHRFNFSGPSGPAPSRFFGFLLKSDLSNNWASVDRNWGIESLAFKIWFIVSRRSFPWNGSWPVTKFKICYWIKVEILPKSEIFNKNRNFNKKSKVWIKIELWSTMEILRKIEILTKLEIIRPKSKVWIKIEILRKIKIWWKIEILTKIQIFKKLNF